MATVPVGWLHGCQACGLMARLLGLPGLDCTQPCCACSLEGVLGRLSVSVPLEGTWCRSSYSCVCVCVLVWCSVKAYLFHQLWASSSIAVCLLLMRRLSDRFSSIVCLQFSETAPVGKAVCSHHSLKREKKVNRLLKLQWKHGRKALALSPTVQPSLADVYQCTLMQT